MMKEWLVDNPVIFGLFGLFNVILPFWYVNWFFIFCGGNCWWETPMVVTGLFHGVLAAITVFVATIIFID